MKTLIIFIGLSVCIGSSAHAEDSAPTATVPEALCAEITRYLDELEAYGKASNRLSRPGYSKITQKYDWRIASKELFRQARERNSEYVYGEILAARTDHDFDYLHEVARLGLDSTVKRFHYSAIRWYRSHPHRAEGAERDKVRQEIRKLLQAEKPRERGLLSAIVVLGTKQDIPWLRKIYKDHFFTPNPSYTCAHALPANGTVSATSMLLALAKLGDDDLRTRIAQAITQENDLQQRAWGLFIAAHLNDPKLVPLMAKALDDRRRVPEAIEQWRDPDAKGPHLHRVSYHRVCDVALRAIWTIDRPGDKWPFKATGLGGWTFLHGASNRAFPYVEPLDKEFSDQQRVFLNHVILGYTDEQLEQVREYVKKRPALLDKGR